jgi:hypothetical protein
VKGHDRLLVLAAHAQALDLLGVGGGGEVAHLALVGGDLGIDLDPGGAGRQQLGAVVSRVGDRAQRDHLARGGRAPAADAADDRVALGHGDELRARGLGDGGVVGVAHDRRERAVDVQQDRRPGRVGAQGGERLGERGGGGHGP